MISRRVLLRWCSMRVLTPRDIITLSSFKVYFTVNFLLQQVDYHQDHQCHTHIFLAYKQMREKGSLFTLILDNAS